MSNSVMKINHDRRENNAISDIEMINQEIINLRNELNAKTLEAFPIGIVYISFNNTSPQTLFGGTWQQLENGKMLLSSNTSGTTGGSDTINITSAQLPTMSGSGTTGSKGSGYSASTSVTGHGSYTLSLGSYNSNHSNYINTTGDHNHVIDENYSFYIADGNEWGFIGRTNASANGQMNLLSYAGDHSHTFTYYDRRINTLSTSVSGLTKHTHTFTGTYTNSNQSTVTITNKYVTVFMWKRTA